MEANTLAVRNSLEKNTMIGARYYIYLKEAFQAAFNFEAKLFVLKPS
jgi:hypothetical protein